MTSIDGPAPDELEVSIFGPGRGECILVHLGFNQWCMTDSCMDPIAALPVGVRYLRQLGNDAGSGVRLVVATHWHDDHVRGIAEALEQFPNAKFACSTALRAQEFLQLVTIESRSLATVTATAELGRILRLASSSQNVAKQLDLQFAMQDRLLLRIPRSQDRPFESVVTSLSPSDVAIHEAFKVFASLIPDPGETQVSIPDQSANAVSVVLWIRVGRRTLLMGGDLTHLASRPREGWLAILSAIHSDGKAELFKVPHHGSPDSDCAQVWSELLHSQPIAILTPYSSSRRPRQEDLERLKSRTPHVYCTARPTVKPPKRDSSVDRMLRGLDRVAVPNNVGHIRIRWSALDASSAPRVDLFDGAYRA
jgi:Metallo-beta-lactamase superfamily